MYSDGTLSVWCGFLDGYMHISSWCIKCLSNWKGRSYSCEFGLWYDLEWYELTHCTLFSEYNEQAAHMHFCVTSRVLTSSRMWFWRKEGFQICNFWRKGKSSKHYLTDKCHLKINDNTSAVQCAQQFCVYVHDVWKEWLIVCVSLFAWICDEWLVMVCVCWKVM